MALTTASGMCPVFNGELYYEVTGSGAALLFIHAGVANLRMWDDQVDHFAPSYKVVCFDTRGFGRSRSQDTSFSNVQDILDLLDYLGIEQAALIGISRGGGIAVDFVLEHPERVSALVVVAGGFSGYDNQEGSSEQATLEEELFNRMEALWEQAAFEELNEMETHMWTDGPGQPVGRAPAHVRKQVHAWNYDNLTRQDGEATPTRIQPPAAARLEQIQVPTLVIYGDLDTTGTLAMGEELARRIPNAQKVVFPGVAHMVNLEKPPSFNQTLQHFLSANV